MTGKQVPFQDSVTATLPGGEGGTYPPKTKVDVCVPSAPMYALAVFRSCTSDQLVPLYDSFIAR